jgi:alpha-beta hydrolase superfamily lysophospholipase
VRTFTASDGYRWRYRCYEPPGGRAPRAHVVCLHGIQSHGGWYGYSCRRLSESGYLVSFLDRRGSGLNDEARGDAPGFRRLLDDVAEFLSHERGQVPSRRMFLLAISWGGKLAVALERSHPGLVDGLVLLCPGFFPRVRPSLRERLRIAWSFLTAPGRMFPIPLGDPELFTASPDWQEFLRKDPRALHEATARFLVHSVRLDRYVRGSPRFVRIPVLLMLAGQDRIIDNIRTRRFVETFATTDQQYRYDVEAHHTLEFEPQPHPFVDELLRWLDLHSPA